MAFGQRIRQQVRRNVEECWCEIDPSYCPVSPAGDDGGWAMPGFCTNMPDAGSCEDLCNALMPGTCQTCWWLDPPCTWYSCYGENACSQTCEPPVTVYGCTDPSAFNYDPDANTDDGSCWCDNGTYNGQVSCMGYTENECGVANQLPEPNNAPTAYQACLDNTLPCHPDWDCETPYAGQGTSWNPTEYCYWNQYYADMGATGCIQSVAQGCSGWLLPCGTVGGTCANAAGTACEPCTCTDHGPYGNQTVNHLVRNKRSRRLRNIRRR